MSDDELLKMRICDLKVQIAGSELEARIARFHRELGEKGIVLKPLCYLGDEWFCAEGAANIAIPFYLAHPRLKRLEEKMMMEVEGGTEAWCMRLLRHEMGHVMNHAYLLAKDKEWQKIFGPPSLEYSESFRARPYSKRFVRHLEGWYAQSHPEEDFSETLAIWLTPEVDWRSQYRGGKEADQQENAARAGGFSARARSREEKPPKSPNAASGMGERRAAKRPLAFSDFAGPFPSAV